MIVNISSFLPGETCADVDGIALRSAAAAAARDFPVRASQSHVCLDSKTSSRQLFEEPFAAPVNEPIQLPQPRLCSLLQRTA